MTPNRSIIERAQLEYSLLSHLPSLLAACAVSMARAISDLSAWTNTLEYFTGYTQGKLFVCVEALQRVFALETAETGVE